jgi:hypothetical protein
VPYYKTLETSADTDAAGQRAEPSVVGVRAFKNIEPCRLFVAASCFTLSPALHQQQQQQLYRTINQRFLQLKKLS